MFSQRWIRGGAALFVAVALLTAGSRQSVSAGDAVGEYFDLDKLPQVQSSGKTIADSLQTFAAEHPLRTTGSPTELKAAELLRSETAALGYESAIVPLPLANGTPTPPNSPLSVVTATKRGTTKPDEWILFVGHYDNFAATVYGAYDNGAGTNLLRFLARELASVPTNRSIMFAWYNGEEEGVLASARHAAMLKAQNRNIAAVLGFDMVGIGYPVKPAAGIAASTYCLCLYHGARDAAWAKPLLTYVNQDFLGFPDGRTEVPVVGANVRNSDEASFASQGYRTLRWTGMRTAANYPGYHRPDDTMETIDRVAGGRDMFEAGSLNTLKSAYYTALTIDNHAPAPRAVATVSGASVAFDATGSSDADGALSEFRWDFGDGTTAVGPTATHVYAAPGTYTAKLTVSDNLWSAVQRTVTIDVTVG